MWAEVPACGYQTVILRLKEAVAPISFNDPGEGVRVEHPLEMVLENELVRAEFDSATGRLNRFIDKTTGQVRLAGAGFDFIEEDPSEGMTSWRVGRYMNIRNAGTRVKSAARPGAGCAGDSRCPRNSPRLPGWSIPFIWTKAAAGWCMRSIATGMNWAPAGPFCRN